MTDTQYIERAIRDAVAGGYTLENLMLNGSIIYENEFSSAGIRHPSDVWMDPLFWSCLGKALGWGESFDPRDTPISVWHRFIDALAEGKSAESFFDAVYKWYA